MEAKCLIDKAPILLCEDYTWHSPDINLAIRNLKEYGALIEETTEDDVMDLNDIQPAIVTAYYRGN